MGNGNKRLIAADSGLPYYRPQIATVDTGRVRLGWPAAKILPTMHHGLSVSIGFRFRSCMHDEVGNVAPYKGILIVLKCSFACKPTMHVFRKIKKNWL